MGPTLMGPPILGLHENSSQTHPPYTIDHILSTIYQDYILCTHVPYTIHRSGSSARPQVPDFEQPMEAELSVGTRTEKGLPSSQKYVKSWTKNRKKDYLDPKGIEKMGLLGYLKRVWTIRLHTFRVKVTHNRSMQSYRGLSK